MNFSREYSRSKHRVITFKISLGDLQYCLDIQAKRLRIVRPTVILFSQEVNREDSPPTNLLTNLAGTNCLESKVDIKIRNSPFYILN